jgi:hypothetical protein
LTIVEATSALVAVLARVLAREAPALNAFQSVLDRYPLVLVVAGGNTLKGTLPVVKLLAFKPVIADPLPAKVPENVAEEVPPEKVVAVIVPAVKFPDPSRLTIVEATLALVAVLVALEARDIAELNVFQSVLDK